MLGIADLPSLPLQTEAVPQVLRAERSLCPAMLARKPGACNLAVATDPGDSVSVGLCGYNAGAFGQAWRLQTPSGSRIKPTSKFSRGLA